MANLAIIGHPLEGNKVIEILKMLGGRDIGYNGLNSQYYYYIDEYGNIAGTSELPNNKIFFVIYTLKEFLEKFPYKVGDKVKNARINDCIGRITNVRWDSNENQIIYEVEWDDMIKRMLPYFARDLQPYKEAPRYLNEKANKQAKEIEKLLEPAKEIIENIIKIDIPKGYEFTGVDNQQVVFEKVKPKYPKTYVECAKLLDCFGAAHIDGYKGELLDKFQELLICRDAYWKIAGEQMGLGKSWNPSKSNSVYCIFRFKGDIVKDNFVFGDSLILEFPTEEMRDAFFENFKDLIEQCKKLL